MAFPLATGTVLDNRYRVVALLGQGGMGAVYRAWDINLSKVVAVKENRVSTPGSEKQFFREASILSSVNHPNLPRVTDYFAIAGQGQYLVMDFIDGEDLESKSRGSGYLQEKQALEWVTQVCDALTYLHNLPSPIIHRDIKPANIRVNTQGQAVLVDFGIAKVYQAGQATDSAARYVTPNYSPVEMYASTGTTPRSDQYALGATLYTLLTGKPPMESIQRLAAQSAGDATGGVIPPRAVHPWISEQTSQAVMKAMALSPDERFSDVAAFKLAMTTLMPTMKVAPPISPTIAVATSVAPTPTPAPVAKDRSKIWVGLGAVLLLIMIIGGIFYFRNGENEPRQKSRSDTTPTLPVIVADEDITRAPTSTALLEAPDVAITLPPLLTPTSTSQNINPGAGEVSTSTPPPLPAPTAESAVIRRTSARVLWDVSHGPDFSDSLGGFYSPDGTNAVYSQLKELLAGQGITLVSGSIANLEGFDAVVIASVSAKDQAYTPEEAQRLNEFVQNGGGLLIQGEDPNYLNRVQAVGDVFGIQFALPPVMDVPTSAIGEHSILQGVNTIDPFGGGGLEVDPAMATEVVWWNGTPFIAVAEPGRGRLVATGDGGLFDNRILGQADNSILAINLFRWLTFIDN
jgi:serine/threonine protein kinase